MWNKERLQRIYQRYAFISKVQTNAQRSKLALILADLRIGHEIHKDVIVRMQAALRQAIGITHTQSGVTLVTIAMEWNRREDVKRAITIHCLSLGEPGLDGVHLQNTRVFSFTWPWHDTWHTLQGQSTPLWAVWATVYYLCPFGATNNKHCGSRHCTTPA